MSSVPASTSHAANVLVNEIPRQTREVFSSYETSRDISEKDKDGGEVNASRAKEGAGKSDSSRVSAVKQVPRTGGEPPFRQR